MTAFRRNSPPGSLELRAFGRLVAYYADIVHSATIDREEGLMLRVEVPAPVTEGDRAGLRARALDLWARYVWQEAERTFAGPR